jgi:hypothetical protein
MLKIPLLFLFLETACYTFHESLLPQVILLTFLLHIISGQSSGAYAPHQDPQEDPPALVSPALYYGLCGAGALLMVVLSLLGAAFVRRRVREKRQRDHCTLTLVCGLDAALHFYFILMERFCSLSARFLHDFFERILGAKFMR